MSRGRIEKALSGFYYVNTGDAVLQCRARGKFRREGLSPLVGDWVQVLSLIHILPSVFYDRRAKREESLTYTILRLF